MKHDADRQVDVSRETHERLQKLADLIAAWNERINLISRNDIPAIWSRHIADSLRLVPFVPAGQSEGADLGSGAGFPGIVLAIATGRRMHLIESDTRKAAFLREAARQTNANAVIHPTRVERRPVQNMAFVTARAFAPLPRLLPLAVPLLAPDGELLLLKGASASAELTAACTEWHMKTEIKTDDSKSGGCVLRLWDLRRVGV